VLADDRILSWSRDCTLRLWAADGTPLATLERHGQRILGAKVLAEGRIVSWDRDGTLCVWAADGTPLATMAGDTDWARGATELADGRILSWADDTALRLWAPDGSPLATLGGHADRVSGAIELADSRILSWSWGGTLHRWATDGTAVGHWRFENAPDALLTVCHQARGLGRLVRNGVAVRNWRYRLSAAGAVWHATAAPTPQAFLEDGTVVATMASGHVFCLKLHHGSRRVTAAEAVEIARGHERGTEDTVAQVRR
jgi:WD40 repeat protein